MLGADWDSSAYEASILRAGKVSCSVSRRNVSIKCFGQGSADWLALQRRNQIGARTILRTQDECTIHPGAESIFCPTSMFIPVRNWSIYEI